MTKPEDPSLTVYENRVLAIIGRDGPITAYRVCKIIEDAPSSGGSSSPGAVYPVVVRLKSRALISVAAISNGGRNSEILVITKEGRAAIRRWIKQQTPEQSLPVDLLRTKVVFADALGATERSAWLRKSRSALEKQLVELDHYSRRYSGGSLDYAHLHAKRITQARIDWIDEVLELEARQRSGSGSTADRQFSLG